VSNFGLSWRKEGDKVLTIIVYSILDKLNKNRNSVMHKFEDLPRKCG